MSDIMTVGDIMEKLKDIDKTLPLFLASDEDRDVIRCIYKDKIEVGTFKLGSTYADGCKNYDDVSFGIVELTDELLSLGFTEEDVYEEKGVILG